MTRRTRLTASVTVLALFLAATWAAAEDPQDLVGKWKGYRVVKVRNAEERRDHSFTVKAVREAEGKLVADAVDGQGRALPMTVSVVDGQVYVEYTLEGSGASVRLRLEKGTVLRGEGIQRGGRGGGGDVRLEKQ